MSAGDDEEPSDEALLRAYAQGDAAAFERLYQRHAAPVWRFVLRSLNDRALADEVTQDAWFAVAREAPRFEPRAKFRTWLFTLAHHRLVDVLRARRGERSLDEEDPEDGSRLAERIAADSGFGPVRRIENRQQAEQLLAALAALPGVQRQSFLLQAEGGMSVAEVAGATGVGLETAKSRLRYARAALRQALENLA